MNLKLLDEGWQQSYLGNMFLWRPIALRASACRSADGWAAWQVCMQRAGNNSYCNKQSKKVKRKHTAVGEIKLCEHKCMQRACNDS